MKSSFVLGSSIALFLGAAAAQYDEEVCDEQRFGEYSDPRVYFPNAWNEKKDPNGFICMKVDNSTPAFDVTWNWSTDINDVHSFPYVRLNDADLPTRLSTLREIRLSVDWTMTAGNPSTPPRNFTQAAWEENKVGLDREAVRANAAWDFFLDGNKTNTYNPVEATIEVMVWLGRVGNPYWLGRADDKKISEVTIGNYTFDLYHALNFRNHSVFTAVPQSEDDILTFDEDLQPLFKYILDNPTNIENFPEDPWLGIVEFGSETWQSDGNVTFTAANFAMQLDADGPSNDAGNGGGSGGNGNGGTGNDDGSAAAITSMSVLGFVLPAMAILGAVWA